MEFLIGHFNYFMYITMMMIGLFAMISKNNLVKKIVGMNIFQWSIILFFVSLGSKSGEGSTTGMAKIPILTGVGHGHLAEDLVIKAADFVNPLPHVLMLTAIVVGVGTTGVALALILRIYKQYGTLEEKEIMRKR